MRFGSETNFERRIPSFSLLEKERRPPGPPDDAGLADGGAAAVAGGIPRGTDQQPRAEGASAAAAVEQEEGVWVGEDYDAGSSGSVQGV